MEDAARGQWLLGDEREERLVRAETVEHHRQAEAAREPEVPRSTASAAQ